MSNTQDIPSDPSASTQIGSGVGVPRLVRHLDLFSGIGGFALAAQMVGGIETVGFCEIDPWAQKVLAKNFPSVPIHDDVKTLSGNEYGKIDIITGGIPCQPFSKSGKQTGIEDERYLWSEMLRIIAYARPSKVLVENVPPILGKASDQIQADLENQGYSVQTFLLPASAVGANHERNRWYSVAMHTDTMRCSGKQRAIKKIPECNTDTFGVHWRKAPSRGFRVANGVPRAVDRNRGLANAIVPQIAAEILRCMMCVDSLPNTGDKAR